MAKKIRPAVSITILGPRKGAPENLLANARLNFHEGLMADIGLDGIALWKSKTEEGRRFVSVTFPSDVYEKQGGERDFYSHVRGKSDDLRRLKVAIVAAFRTWAAEEGIEVAEDPDPAGGGQGGAEEATPF